MPRGQRIRLGVALAAVAVLVAASFPRSDSTEPAEAKEAKRVKEDIAQHPRFKKAMELMEMKLLAQMVTDRYRGRVVQQSQVTPEDVRAYYDEHLSEFVQTPRFTARHLVAYVKGNPAFPEKGQSDVKARQKAESALAALRAGTDWDKVVLAFSDEVTTSRGGIIRDAEFGRFAPEVEQAVRTQELGKPGGVVRSAFGYHILQVETRILVNQRERFEKVKALAAERLTQAKASEATMAFILPLRQEVVFTKTAAAERDTSLLDEEQLAADEVLGEVGGTQVLESDFRWFLKDAILPGQRAYAYSRPGARLSMLSSFLDMLVLEAKARKEGLDQARGYLERRAAAEASLLAEFQRESARVGSRPGRPSQSDPG